MISYFTKSLFFIIDDYFRFLLFLKVVEWRIEWVAIKKNTKKNHEAERKYQSKLTMIASTFPVFLSLSLSLSLCVCVCVY